MDQTALQTLLNTLISTWENEVVEFKEVGDNYSTSDIGKYFSALSNEANLRGLEKAWLVFGVNNQSKTPTHTDFRLDPERLQGTKKQIADGTEPSVTFRNIYEYIHHSVGRVILFEIPAAPRGMPISWNGHSYARAGESLTALGVDKQDEIRQQTLATDWSAKIVPNATINDLDEAAIEKAYESFAKKRPDRFSPNEVRQWPLATFLDRARITQNGQITRTALLLLGKAESSHLLTPHHS
jgi:ATP-dependent DNA helicase RecG